MDRTIEERAWEVVYAERNLNQLKAEYRDLASSLYITPDLNLFPNLAEWWCGDLTSETQFVSFAAHSYTGNDRKPIYEYSARGWREIDEADWREINDLECQILDAWEEFNETLWVARDITGEQWQELRAQGVVA